MTDFRNDPYSAFTDALSALNTAYEQYAAANQYFGGAYQLFVVELVRAKSHFDTINLADMTAEMIQQQEYVNHCIKAVDTLRYNRHKADKTVDLIKRMGDQQKKMSATLDKASKRLEKIEKSIDKITKRIG